MPFVLGIITARGGSKGIPDKNITTCGGKPLIAWTIEAALKSSLDDIVLSTDSQKILDTARQFHDWPDDLRHPHLATDEAKSIDVIIYELLKYEDRHKRSVDAVMVLQPTAPLRTSQDIDSAMEIFNRFDRESLISICDAGSYHPSTLYTKTGNFLNPFQEKHTGIRRQDMPDVFVRNGAIYISSRNEVMNNNRLVNDHPSFYEMPRERSVNVDEIFDLELADWLLSKNLHADTQS